MGDRLYRGRKLLNSGKILQNRYCIKKMIGQGGFGISYLSVDFAQDKDVSLEKHTAVKRLRFFSKITAANMTCLSMKHLFWKN